MRGQKKEVKKRGQKKEAKKRRQKRIIYAKFKYY
jgi:hypothetical protein